MSKKISSIFVLFVFYVSSICGGSPIKGVLSEESVSTDGVPIILAQEGFDAEVRVDLSKRARVRGRGGELSRLS